MIMIVLVVLLGSSTMAQTRPAAVQEDNASGWKEFSSAEGQFKVSLPGTPRSDIATVGTPFGELKSHFFVLETDTFLYYVSYVDLPAGPQTPEEIKAALDQSRDRALAKARLISENDITLEGIAGKELLVAGESGLILKGRFFYAKQLLYHVIVSAPSNVVFRDGKPSPNAKDRTDLFEQSSAKFLDSFRLSK